MYNVHRIELLLLTYSDIIFNPQPYTWAGNCCRPLIHWVLSNFFGEIYVFVCKISDIALKTKQE